MAATPTLIAANFAKSSLASSLAPGVLTMSLTPGTGVKYPSPGANQYFVVEMKDALTGTLVEVIYVTSRSGDTLSGLLRAQEGTSGAHTWLAGDQVNCVLTAGAVNTSFVQLPTLQQQAGNYAPDTGTADAAVLTLSTVPAAYTGGLVVRWRKMSASNTGAYTLNANGIGVTPVRHPDGTDLVSGELAASGTYEATYDAVSSVFVLSGISGNSGLTPTQLQQQAGNYAPDTGTGNNIIIALNPSPASLAALDGVVVRIKKSGTVNTGACNINPNGFGGKTLTYASGEAISPGTLKAGGDFEVIYNSTTSTFVLLSVASSDQIRSLLLTTSTIAAVGILNLGGFKLQWAAGTVDPANTTEPSQTISWAAAFNNCLWAGVSMNIAAPDTNVDVWYQTCGWTMTGVTVQRQYPGTGSVHQTTQPFVLGIGN